MPIPKVWYHINGEVPVNTNPRQVAFCIIRDLERRGQVADVVFNHWMNQAQLEDADRRLTTELVYGCIRRRRSLDALINQFAKKKSNQQPPPLRTILSLGLYQLCYLNQIPAAAAVHTSVELAKTNGLSGLKSVVNGILRQYLRQTAAIPSTSDPILTLKALLDLPSDPIEQLGILYSFPNWLIQFWLEQLGQVETEKLCHWFNQSPTLDLRINPLKTTREAVIHGFKDQGLSVDFRPEIPQGLRLHQSTGQIQQLPGYNQGWWTVQDSSAQLVSQLLDPQPGETIIDACAAPGGKTTHIAELMADTGQIIALDKVASRLKKLRHSLHRLQLNSIQIKAVDIRQCSDYHHQADRVLLDAPCSGLGTLHRRADGRWRQTPENIQTLSQLQAELLAIVSNWVKPGGCLVYATCTLHPQENERVIQAFLKDHQDWNIEPPPEPLSKWSEAAGWMKVWPHRHQMDGFFMVKLRLNPEAPPTR